MISSWNVGGWRKLGMYAHMRRNISSPIPDERNFRLPGAERAAERRAEEAGRRVLPVEHLEEADDGAHGQRLDLQPASRHLLDRLGELDERAMPVVGHGERALDLGAPGMDTA
jgi:hypothetical protein